MNQAKLASQSYSLVDKACLIHAEKALELKHLKPKLAKAHAVLLDQCANILRAKKGLKPNKNGTAAFLLHL